MTITTMPERPLTPEEADTLAEQEAVVAHGLQTFYDVGTALAAIRDLRLYRADYKTFEDYCQSRWNMTRQHVNRLVASAAVIRNLEPIGSILPSSESQARPLAQLPPAQQGPAWQRAVETADNGRVTARHVEQAVEYFRPPPQPSHFAEAVSDALVNDGSYRENILLEQYHAVMQRLLAAATAGRDLVRHIGHEEMAELLTDEDGKTFSYVAELLEWLQRTHTARMMANGGLWRVK